MSRLKTLAMLAAVALTAAPVLAQEDRPRPDRPGRPDRPDRGPGRFGRGQFGYLGLLRIPEVREELNVTEDQQQKIREIGEQFRAERPEFNPDASPEERRAQFARMREEAEAREKEIQEKLGAVLDENQMKRLRGLWIQQVGALRALSDEQIAEELKLTDEQRQKLAAQREEQASRFRGPRGERGPGAEGDRPRGDRGARFREARREAEEQALSVLTDEQKAAFEALKGEAFEFPAPRFEGRGGRGRPDGDRPQRRRDRQPDA